MDKFLTDLKVDDPAFVHFRVGERCWVRSEGRAVAGTIVSASTSGRSLCIDFEAIVDGHAALMPVVWDDEQSKFRILMTANRVILAREPTLVLDS